MPNPPLLQNTGQNPYQAPSANMSEAYTAAAPQTVLGLLFSFDGRVGRGMFWLVGVGAAVLFYAVMFASVGLLGEETGILVMIPLYLVWLWVGLAITVKRWHDRNKSGWWIFIAMIPLIGALWAFIEQGFLPGDEGPNRFGNPPG